MKQILTLYHGSAEVIVAPLFGKGNPHNDYGPGFYCTEIIDLAREWSSRGQELGIVNKYRLDCKGLDVLDLSGQGYNILNWLAILLENRNFELSSPLPADIKDYILREFLPDYHSADIIRGYRADDSYFSFAKDFLSNSISLSQLNRAMKLGRLGEQVVLKSRKAFDALEFEEAIAAEGSVYFPKRVRRDISAREDYFNMRREGFPAGAVTALDIVRNGLTSDSDELRI